MLLLIAMLLSGCTWLEGASECKPACDKVFDETECAVDIGVIDHTAITACVSRCGEQSEAVRTEWIYCVAGASCEELHEGECLDAWVVGGTGAGAGVREQIPIDTGDGR